jgi:putative phosphoribosyl transferase
MKTLERKRLERPVIISAGPVRLSGDVAIPAGAQGLVLFAHGSGSSRFSPRNRMVAAELRRSGVGTLLFDLLTDREAGNRARVFDIPLLAERLWHATSWVLAEPDLRGLRVGYFGASTGAAAALLAAARRDSPIGAIVSRGGRPDLASDALPNVAAPTLLIVGANDAMVLDLNQSAYDRLTCPKRLEVVPRATHLFEEPGALERVAQVAAEWFTQYLGMKKAQEA